MSIRDILIPTGSLATVLAAISIAVAGWFANGEAVLANKVESLSTQQAATAQQAVDIDARLTRIENKLDSVLNISKQ